MARAQRIGSLLGLVILAVVLSKTGLQEWSHLKQFWPSWPWALVSFGFHFLGLFIGAKGWLLVLRTLGMTESLEQHRTNYWLSLPYQSLSGLGGTAVARWWVSRDQHVPHRTMVTALFLEKAFSAVGGLVVIAGLALWLLLPERWMQTPLEVFLGFVLVSLLVLPFLPERSRQTAAFKTCYLYTAPLPGVCVMGILTLLKAFHLQGARSLIQVALAYALSWWIGQLTVVIPQGLGIREALFTYFLRNSTGTPWGFLFSIWARIILAMAQALPVLGLWFRRAHRPPSRPDSAQEIPMDFSNTAKTAMRFCLVTSSYPRHPKESINAGVFVRTVALGLRDRGHDVTIFTPRKGDDMVVDKGLTLHAFRWGGNEAVLTRLSMHHPLQIFQILSLWLAGTASALFREHRYSYDRILAFWAIPSGWFGACLSNRSGIPLDVWVLGSDIWRRRSYPMGERIVRYVLGKADHVFADGTDLKTESERLSGREVQLLRSMRKLPNVAAATLPSGLTRFLFVGRWDTVKGVDIFCDAFIALSKNMPCEAHIFGQGPLEPWLKARLASERHARIVLHGQAPPEIVTAYLKACDFLVISSRQESLPVIFSDALQCGLPVIASSVGDLPDVIQTHRVGLCVPPEDIPALTLAMRQAAQNGKNTWVSACQKLAQTFNPERMVDDYLTTVYKR